MQENYNNRMEKIINSFDGEKKTLLLHSCCAPCSSAVIEKLKEYLDLVNNDQYASKEAISLRKQLESNFKNSEPVLEEATLIIENKEWEKSLYEESNKA